MKNWETLEGACLNCQKCDLWRTRTNVVIGKGNKNADIMFIGEGPGNRRICRAILLLALPVSF